MKPTAYLSQAEIILAGLVGIVVVLQVASLVWPSDFRMVGLLLLSAGLVNWRLKNDPVRAALESLRRLAVRPIFWLAVVAVLIFGVDKAWYFDSGMYHIPAIRWYERFRVIPGLGNLHGRLAFNSSFFVTSAAFGFTALVGQTLFALNSFLLLVFSAYVTGRLRLPAATPGLRGLQVLVLVLVFYYLLQWVSSPTPDIWATLLPLFVFFFWLDGPPDMSRPRFYLLASLALLCLTIKLGTLPLLLFLPVILFTNPRFRSLSHLLSLTALGG